MAMNEREKAERQRIIIVRVFSAIAIVSLVFLGMVKYQHTFSENKWASNPDDRYKLVENLFEKHNLIGMHEADVIALLGEEDSDKSSFKISRKEFPPDTTLVYYLGVDFMDNQWLIISLVDGIVYEYCIDVT